MARKSKRKEKSNVTTSKGKFPEYLYVRIYDDEEIFATQHPYNVLDADKTEGQCARYKLDTIVTVKEATVVIDGDNVTVVERE